jgi:hypothetical protein
MNKARLSVAAWRKTQHLKTLLGQKDVLNVCAAALLLLKGNKTSVELVYLVAWHMIQSILVNGSSTFSLLTKLLKLCEMHVQLLHVFLFFQHLRIRELDVLQHYN